MLEPLVILSQLIFANQDRIKNMYNEVVFTKNQLFSRTHTKEIKISERVQNYNKKHKINISNRDYAYLVLTFYGEQKGSLNTAINRTAYANYKNIYKSGFKVDNLLDTIKIGDIKQPITRDSIRIEDVLLADNAYSIFNKKENGESLFKEQIERAIEKDDLSEFVIHGEDYNKTIYDDLIKNKEFFFLSNEKRNMYKNEVKLRTTKLWSSINYIERHTARMITDPNYNPLGDYVVYYNDPVISTHKALGCGKEAFFGFDQKVVGNYKNHVLYVLEGKKVGKKQYKPHPWNARNKLKNMYVDKKHTKKEYISQSSNNSNLNRD